MKKEVFAIVLLISIFVGSLVNLYCLKNLTNELIELVESGAEYASDGNWKEAAQYVEKATDKWAGSDSYTHIVLRHSEINSTTDAFYELLKGIYSENYGDSTGAARMLIDHLTSIAKMEEIRLGSIF